MVTSEAEERDSAVTVPGCMLRCHLVQGVIKREVPGKSPLGSLSVTQRQPLMFGVWERWCLPTICYFACSAGTLVSIRNGGIVPAQAKH